MPPRSRAARASAAAVLLACACAPSPHEPRTLALARFDQAGADGVLLNEPLTFHFSGDLDGATATPASVRIRAADGKPARGRWRADRRTLTFRPDPPARADLADAGLRPDTDYHVELVGFPELRALRGQEGEPLRATYRAAFRTVSAASAGQMLFEDRTIDAAAPIRVRSDEIDRFDPIELVCDEPLDPRSVFADDFVLFREVEEKPFVLPPVPLEARLASNEAEGAVLELRPARGTAGELVEIAPGTYHLSFGRKNVPGRLRDLGGHAVSAEWAMGGALRTTALQVAGRGAGRSEGRMHLSFLDPGLRSPVEVPGSDGTVAWSDAGRAYVRFPAAAGAGVDGRVVLDEREGRKRIEASRLLLPAGQTTKLEASGLVVLAAQGRIEIEGELLRYVETGAHARREGESFADWKERVPFEPGDWSTPAIALEQPSVPLPPKRPHSLSKWIEDAQTPPASRKPDDPPWNEPDWTVLIAGGDLVVRGAIRTDGPLLLVAGGVIRLTGPVEARQVWRLRDEGGAEIYEFAYTRPVTTLEIDSPRDNPLVDELHMAVHSHVVSPPHGVARWHEARVGKRDGCGTAQVRFLGERDRPGQSVETIGPVDDVRQLEGSRGVQVLIDLRVPAGTGEAWDPPSVDFVELSWDEPNGAGLATSGGER